VCPRGRARCRQCRRVDRRSAPARRRCEHRGRVFPRRQGSRAGRGVHRRGPGSVRRARGTGADMSTMDPSALGRLTDGTWPDARGRFGDFGGRFVPETLMLAVTRLEAEAREALADPVFGAALAAELKDWVGRPTPLTPAPRLSEAWGAEVWLKREDLAHTGAHKINNAIGQALLAQRMGAKRVVAEPGAGQHGVATAAACARLGLPCVVYMGAVDVERQAP